MRYIEIDPKKLKGTFINLSKLMSFSWANIFIVIGARDYGKTYFFKRKLTKDFIYQHKKFIVVRDTIEACEKIAEEKGIKFFGDIFKENKHLHEKHTYNITGMSINIDNKLAGEIMPLSAFYKYKGNYYDAENVLFDEFIPESVQAYRGNRARQFVNTIETIVRDRNVNIYLTANALDLGNDILEILDIKIKNNKYGYYCNKEKGVVVYYAPDSEEFIKRKKNSIAGKIAKGTFLEDNLLYNKFENGDCILFEKRKPCNLFGIYYNKENEALRLYKSNNSEEFFACKDINPNSYTYMRYVFETKQIATNRKYANNNVRKFLENLLINKKVYFESKYLFGIYCSIINKTLKK